MENKATEKLKENISKIKKEAEKTKNSDKKQHGKVEELTDSLQRLQAEFENYKKRVDREKEDFSRYAKAELIGKLLTTLDTFEIALKNSKDHEKFLKGMEMVYAQLLSTLEDEGLRPIPAEGERFDPYRHEVMMKVKSDKEDGTVVEELQKGYMLNDKVLRYSKVKVSEKEDKEVKNNNQDKDN